MPADRFVRISRSVRRLLPFSGKKPEGGEHDEKNAVDPPLPYLPAQRRPLTPTPSRESLVSRPTDQGPHDSATTSSLFFASLPPELRRAVLIAAFGERTLHLDLRLNRPLLPAPSAAAETSRGHCGSTAPLYLPAARDRAAPRTWQWWSCECHRQVPPGSEFEQRARALGWAVSKYPKDDGCIRGEAGFCERLSSEGLPHCTAGVMGWLLACRQAYTEGIEVLYSTNTFFIESEALFDTLLRPSPRAQHLLLPARLAAITSLELRWDVVLFGHLPGPTADPHRDAALLAGARARLAAHLAHLADPARLPRLRRVVLSFLGGLYSDPARRPARALDDLERVLLRPLAAVAARPPSGGGVGVVVVVVELPSNVFRDLRGAAAAARLGLACATPEGDQPQQPQQQQQHEAWDDRVWLRYPVAPRPRPRRRGDGGAPEDGGGAGLGGAALGEAEGRRDGGAERGCFYYIKQGVESDLFWDREGNARRLSHMPTRETTGHL